jgi:hypothetical protein
MRNAEAPYSNHATIVAKMLTEPLARFDVTNYSPKQVTKFGCAETGANEVSEKMLAGH